MLKPLLLLPVVFILGYHPAILSASNPQATSQAPASGAKSPAKTSPEVPAHVKKIYEVDCALCHGANGNGKTDLAKDMQLVLSDFTDPKTLASMSDQQIFDLIRKGKDKMPPEEEGRAKNDDLRHLITYLRSMAKDQPAPAAAPPESAPAAPTAPATPAPAPAPEAPAAPPTPAPGTN